MGLAIAGKHEKCCHSQEAWEKCFPLRLRSTIPHSLSTYIECHQVTHWERVRIMHKWLSWLPVWGSLFINLLPSPTVVPPPTSQVCSPTRSFKGGFYSAEQFKRKWLLFPGLVCTSVRRWLFRRKWGPRHAGTDTVGEGSLYSYCYIMFLNKNMFYLGVGALFESPE